MTPNQFFETYTKDYIENVASLAGTTFKNFEQIAKYGGSVSKKLSERLESASNGEMTAMEILFPERFKETA